MSSWKFAHLTDVHIADRPVGNRQPTYCDEIWAKLEEVWEICHEQGRDLLFTGDLFDQKSPRLVSHQLVQRLINYFGRWQDAGLNVYGIIGNHDITDDNIGSLIRQPLGSIEAAGVIDLMRDGSRGVCRKVEGHPDIQLVPFHYAPEGEHDPKYFAIKDVEGFDSEARFNVVLTHAMIVPDGMQYPFPYINYSQVNGADAHVWLNGHPHYDYGIHVFPGETTFIQCGSLARRSRVQKRGVRIGLGEIDEQGAKKLKAHKLLSARPWKEIFNELIPEVETVISPEMADLARDVRSLMNFEDLDLEELLQSLAPKTEKGVLTRVRQYIEEAQPAVSGNA